MTPPVPTPPLPSPRATPRRLRFAAHAAVIGAALAAPFVATPFHDGNWTSRRPASVLSALRTSEPTRSDSATLVTAPPARPRPHVRPRPLPLVVRPASGPVSSPFGWRRHPVTGRTRHHDGVDLAVPLGSAVRAVASGVVRFVGHRSGYGLVVEIDHAGGMGSTQYRTLYAHLSSTDRRLRRGVRVARAQPMGASGGVPGRDGLSTGPHLHFEVRDASGRPLDPAFFLGAKSARWTADERRWQVVFSSGRKPLPVRSLRRLRRPTRTAFALPSPAGSRRPARPPR